MTAITDDLPARLIHQEHEGWDALVRGDGGTHFHHAMTGDAVMITPGSVIERGAIIAALQGATWDEYAMSEHRVVRLGDRAAVLAYRVSARRDGSPVELRASTTYLYHEGRWRIGAHQQTPVD